jgi:fused signal recognition particle receptor
LVEVAEERKGNLWRRLTERLSKTRSQLAIGIGDLLLGERVVDDEILTDLETVLLSTDVGIDATEGIMNALKRRVARKDLNDTMALHSALGEELKSVLAPIQRSFSVDSSQHPFVVLMVGVNGVGKTTTIGKLAKLLQADGYSVLLAAGDTFRAGAVEQLKEWGVRNAVPVISQEQGADSAAVIYDAVQAAKARKIDVVLADTAGRLQTNTNLMDELEKIKRVVRRLDENAPHEVILVLDAGVGQNAISQVGQFDAAVEVTGLIVAKLDGSAKAGMLFAISALGKVFPVYFIGVGERMEDLRRFEPGDFVDALLEDGC